MAGHSHFANIARKKALVDNKRGKLWSKLSKGIIVAAKMGGGDPNMNLRLRYAIDAAKAVSMPKDNIERAIKKGTGELDGGNLDEVIYEGYGPGGAAILCEALTDNRNRTAPEIRKIFEMQAGNLGSTNCVAWIFETKGLFVIPQANVDEDTLMEIVLEAGAEDVKRQDENFEVTCATDSFSAVSEAIEKANLKPEVAEITRIPSNEVELDQDHAEQALKLLEKLDEHEDIQHVYSNFTVPDEVLAKMEG